MLFETTALFAGILGIMVSGLGFAVVVARIKASKDTGNEAEATLQRAIRAHGNLTEYAPMFLFILLIAENGEVHSTWLYLMGAAFVFGRLLQIVYFFIKQVFALRVLAFWATVLPILAGALLLFFTAI